MKKFIILLVIISTSCLSSKKAIENDSKTKETSSTEVKVDSASTSSISEAIEDRIVINVPESNDKELMAMFEHMLDKMNTSKVSGSNSYTIRYDDETKQLITDIKVAASKIEKTNTSSDTISEKSFEEEVSEKSEKVIRMIPWWIWLILGVWFLPQILNRVQLILNPLSGLISKTK